MEAARKGQRSNKFRVVAAKRNDVVLPPELLFYGPVLRTFVNVRFSPLLPGESKEVRQGNNNMLFHTEQPAPTSGFNGVFQDKCRFVRPDVTDIPALEVLVNHAMTGLLPLPVSTPQQGSVTTTA